MSALPRGWGVVQIQDIADVGTGATPKRGTKEFYESGTIPWITSGAVSQGRITHAEEFITEAAIRATNCKIFPSGTILMAMYGEGKTRGSVAELAIEAATNQALAAIVIRQNNAVSGKFLTSFLTSQYSQLRGLAAGGVQPNLNLQSVKTTSLPLPPLAEQKRIVAKLDALNAKSARARTELARIETLLSRYKQAVLSKAFSGELGRKELSELVVRIKAGKNLRCEERPPHSDEKGVVKVSAVTWGEFRPDQSKTLPSDFEPEEDTRIKSCDFLFSRANTIDLVGAVVIVGDTPDNLYLSDKILRLEFREPIDKWLLWYLRSPMGREALMNISSGNQLSMRNIGQKSLLSLSIPYANFELRDEIVRRIESAFAKIDRLAKEAKRALELVGRLDEAMLAKAFRGELVPQDENDEPAEHLLARIRAERQAAPKGKRGRGRASTSEKTTQNRSASAMSKSRQDVEPNHLSRLLKSTGGKKPASELWLQSEMDIDEFYKQLRAEMDSGQIMEGQEKGELVLANEN